MSRVKNESKNHVKFGSQTISLQSWNLPLHLSKFQIVFPNILHMQISAILSDYDGTIPYHSFKFQKETFIA